MKKVLPIFVLFVFVLGSTLPAAAKVPKFQELHPGEFTTLRKEVPIKIALVGFDEADVNEDELLAQLPATYNPVVRYPQFYGLNGRDLGLSFEFEYDIINTGNRFEDEFFGYLAETGTQGPPTLFQQYYSGTAPNLPNGQPDPQNQTGSVLDITESLYIDAPSVENWLATEGRELLDTDEDNAYFLYLINWHGEEDFQFHVYTKTDEADPDTGYNFGELRASRKMRGYGGDQNRLWFFDMSAGPELFAGSYNINQEDLDGDNEPDYRIPPIWEYAENGYRDPAKLSTDLGLLTRYVGINLLFTTSPLYDPLVTTPGLGGSKVAHVEMFEDDADPTVSGLDFIDRDYVYNELSSFEPYYNWEVNVESNDPIDPEAERAYRIFSGLIKPGPEDCATEFGSPFAALYCYFTANLDKYVPAYDPNDYVMEVFAFNTTTENQGVLPGLLGFAEENYVNGTQTHVFEFDSALLRQLGYGFSYTTVHELGHHLALSHPHDGYDAEKGLDYGPTGPYYFAWNGDYSDSIMSYLAVSNSFSRFDRDNMYRYETAGYINRSNALAADVLASPEASKVYGLLQQADQEMRQARREFDRWDYERAAALAYSAYNKVRTAAEQLGVEDGTARLMAIPNAAVPREFDFAKE
jgi:hypothetical protein